MATQAWQRPYGLKPDYSAAAQTANFTGVSGNLYRCDCSAGSFTATLPASPSDGDAVGFWLVNDHATNTVAIDRNSQPINDETTIDGTIDIDEAYRLVLTGDRVVFHYDDGTWHAESHFTPNSTLLYNTSTQSVSANTFAVQEFSNEQTGSRGGIGDTANDKVAIRRGGFYFLSGRASFTATSWYNSETAFVFASFATSATPGTDRFRNFRHTHGQRSTADQVIGVHFSLPRYPLAAGDDLYAHVLWDDEDSSETGSLSTTSGLNNGPFLGVQELR